MKDAEGRMYHLQLTEGEVGRYVLLPGDPGRCERIAAHFEEPRLTASHREYTTWTGTLLGERVAAVSTGIGCPSAAIAVEELIAVGADTFIRVGTAGGMQPDARFGDIAVVTAAVRDEGTTPQYIPVEFPAVADLDVTTALRDGAARAGFPFHVGPSHSKDSFYGELNPERMPVEGRLRSSWSTWVAGGAICSEMEAAAIFVLAAVYRKRAGGVMVMTAGPHMEATPEDWKLFDVDRVVRVAVEGLGILIERDRRAATGSGGVPPPS